MAFMKDYDVFPPCVIDSSDTPPPKKRVRPAETVTAPPNLPRGGPVATHASSSEEEGARPRQPGALAQLPLPQLAQPQEDAGDIPRQAGAPAEPQQQEEPGVIDPVDDAARPAAGVSKF